MPLTHPASRVPGQKIAVVVGAGFAGLAATHLLADTENLQIILIDQKNHHLFQPLLYQVATAGLSPSEIAVPIRGEFSNSPNVEVHLGKVSSVDIEKAILYGEEGPSLHYDYLILCCGATHTYFNRPDWEKFAPGLKTIEQATEIRRRILLAFEHAENELDENVQRELLTFVVIGGGPTGVEMAGAISDISKTVLTKDFRRMNTNSARIILVEAGSKVLGAFHESLSQKALEDLQRMGVEVKTSMRVTDINEKGVTLADGTFIKSRTAVWAAGVQASKLDIQPPVERDRAGRIKVTGDFSLKDHPEVFVVGDQAAYELPDQTFLPGLAPAAIQAGRHAAEMIQADLLHKPRQAFKYNDKGIMATIGKRSAVAQVGALRLSGSIAWFGWLFVHVMYIVGFKNKFFVMFQWAWSYVFNKRGSRLITASDWRMEKVENTPTK